MNLPVVNVDDAKAGGYHIGISILAFVDGASIFLLFVVAALVSYVGGHFCPRDRRLLVARQVAVFSLIPYFIYRYTFFARDNFGEITATVVRTILVAWMVYGIMLFAVPFVWTIYGSLRNTFRRVLRRCFGTIAWIVAWWKMRRRRAEDRRLNAIENAKRESPTLSRTELLTEAMDKARHQFNTEIELMYSAGLDHDEEVLAEMFSYKSFTTRYGNARRNNNSQIDTNVVRNIHIESVFGSLVRHPDAARAMLEKGRDDCLAACTDSRDLSKKQDVSRKLLLLHKQIAHRLPSWFDTSTMRLIVDCIVVPDTLFFDNAPHEPPIDDVCNELLEKIALRHDTQKAYDKTADAIQTHYSRKEFTADIERCLINEPLDSFTLRCEELQEYIRNLQSTASHINDQSIQHAKSEYQAIVDRLGNFSTEEHEEIWADVCRKFLSDVSPADFPPLPRSDADVELLPKEGQRLSPQTETEREIR